MIIKERLLNYSLNPELNPDLSEEDLIWEQKVIDQLDLRFDDDEICGVYVTTDTKFHDHLYIEMTLYGKHPTTIIFMEEKSVIDNKWDTFFCATSLRGIKMEEECNPSLMTVLNEFCLNDACKDITLVDVNERYKELVC